MRSPIVRRVLLRAEDRARELGVAAAVISAAVFFLVLAAPFVASLIAGISTGFAVLLAVRTGLGLRGDVLDRLHQAELSLANATSISDAARDLAEHCRGLVHARSAVVLIEGIGDTIRVETGDAKDHPQSVYGTGSRMRLLEDGGNPVGSIAVGPRVDGEDYTARDERILDALAQRVSATLQRLAQAEKIQAEQRKMSDILTSSYDGIFSVGPDLQVRTWNPAMREITGLTSREALGKPSGDVFRPVDDRGNLMTGSRDPGRRGTVEAHSLQITTDEGGERWLTCAYSPLEDGGYVVVVHDETDRILAQRKEIDFVANIGHELRTPFTPIKGFIKTLLRRDDQIESAERLKILEVMDRQANRLEAAIEDLLAVTAVEDAEGLVAISPTDWVTSVGVLVQACREEQSDRDIGFAAQRDLPDVLTDDGRARLVLGNLLSNAVKFSPAGSPIQVQIRTRDNFVVTSVVDQGPGVKQSDRKRIFEKFTRLGNHMTRSEQGVGLGLYFAKTWAEAMGGSVEVDEAPEGGAVFRMVLPASSTSASVVPPTQRPSAKREPAELSGKANPPADGASAQPTDARVDGREDWASASVADDDA